MQPIATSPVQPKQPQPAALAIFGAEVSSHRLERRLVSTQDGRTFQLFLAVPRAEAPTAGYPLLYMLDGNAAFDALTPAHLASNPGLAIIGVGYDTELRFEVMARSLDYTPVEIPSNGRKTGGADAFLDLLAGELRQLSETGIHIDPARRTLWGHSLAGLCTLYALMTKPGAFRRFVSVSPSVWWNDQWLLDFEARAASASREADMLVMLGDAERRSNPAGPHWEGPAPHTLEIVARLQRWPGLSVSMDIFGGLGHAATLPASIDPALAFAGKA